MSDTSLEPRPELLRIASVWKAYSGTQALSGVSMDVREGEIHALAGQNGAGKSTLIRILAGVDEPDEGHIYFEGSEVRPSHAHLPIAFIHQNLGLVETMTVAENFALYTGYPRRRGLVDWRALREHARRQLDLVDCHVDPGKPVGELSIAERSLVAIARAIAQEARILVLDEPTAALPRRDAEHLFEMLKRLRERGVAMIYVTHRLDEIFVLADRVTILRDGARVYTKAIGELDTGGIVEAVAGRSIKQLFPSRVSAGEEVLLDVDSLMIEAIGPVSFELRRGEILALVGLRGAGHESVGRAIFGVEEASHGSVRVEGVEKRGGVRSSIAEGIGFVPGRRAQEGLAGDLSVRENVFLNPDWVGAPASRWRWADRRRAREVIGEFAIHPTDPEREIVTLSGGNQQKVLMARWVQALSRILILEEPTAGVDVGAKTEIYAAVNDLCEAGRGCLLISSDFDEVAGIASRALVFDRGRIVEELADAELTSEAISHAAGGSRAVAAGKQERGA